MAAGVQRLVANLVFQNRLLAREASALFNEVEPIDHARWHMEQVGLWWLLSDTEARIRKLGKRKASRNQKWKRSKLARTASSMMRQEHREAIDLQVHALRERIRIIKQIGDAFAWALALNDPRFIFPLYKESTHQLPQDHSVDGILRVLEAAAQAPDYLMVASDLTRCCGTGDIMVRGIRWPHPSTFEVKVKRQPGGELFSFLYGWSAAFQVYPDEMENFVTALGLTTPGKVSFDERGERQKAEIDERTRQSFDGFVSMTQAADPAIKRHWMVMERIIERVLGGGAVCDVAEPGIAYVAVSVNALDGKIPADELKRLLAKCDIVINDGWNLHLSWDLLNQDLLSALVSPFLLWKLPSHQRVALMTGDVLIGCAVHDRVWDGAFRRARVEMREVDGVWRMSAAGREIWFDFLDVQRLKVGAAFAGISPQYTATIVGAQLYMPGSVIVDRYGRPDTEAEPDDLSVPDNDQGSSATP